MTAIHIGRATFEIRIELHLPMAHAALLKRTAASHYDAAVRESAEAGPINGLFNRALVGEISGQAMSVHDADLCRKALEQCCPATPEEHAHLIETRAALTEIFDRCTARWTELHEEEARRIPR